MKKWKNSIFLLLFLIGLGLILSPIVSSKVEDWSHSKAIADYRSQVAENAAQLEQKKEEARAYNGQLAQPAAQADGQEPTAGYYSLLSFQDVMGYLEIPEIGVNLPIYHGTSDLVLEMGVGHLESSSLPIGGESTHAVLMGHRGLPSSTLFNKLCGQRLAIVEDTPGITRDRIFANCEWNGHDFLLVDTGGIEPKATEGILAHMREQAQIAIDTADCIIMVVDVRDGLTAADEDVAHMLRRSHKPIILAVNK